jgi:CubicO group peptidase (beta-lactamase class C family)/D-alanyl-D-alanine dipeptidase
VATIDRWWPFVFQRAYTILDANRLKSFSARVTRGSIPIFFAAAILSFACGNSGAENIPAGPQFRDVAEKLAKFIRAEIEQKQIPAVSIALIDDQRVVWSEGFGKARTNLAATADTIYRVGSVSKLFTDIALMRLVERGEIDLDAPVTKYVPGFRPKNPFGKEIAPISVRQLMAHRSGLCRETPVGSYFHADEPSLAATIASLNETELTYEPGTRMKYSNAAVALVGYLLELHEKRPFAECIQGLLEPLGLKNSSFVRTAAVRKNLADGLMWTVHGRTFKAPEFELGISPAACMYSSANDLARFMSALFAREKGGVLKPEMWEQMLTVQFAEPGQKQGFRLGFSVSEIDGERAAGHNGAMYGFATQFTGLIDAKLGVVVIASKDFANTVTGRIATKALQAMLAVKRGTATPEFETTEPVERTTMLELAGNYVAGERAFELRASGTNLFMLWNTGGYQHTVRRLGRELITDSALSYGTVLKRSGKNLQVGGVEFARTNLNVGVTRKEWQDFIGEYGWDHNTLNILERDGKLWALIEWFEFNPLERISENEYAFPNRGLYHGEKIVFRRDEWNYVKEVVAAGVAFTNRNYAYLRRPGPRRESLIEVKPVRPIEELRAEAMRAEPPRETNRFRKPDLVELTAKDARLDVRYARTNNFLGTPFYSRARVFLQRPAAEAVKRVQEKMKAQGLGLVLFDGYRPWYVTKIFWEATPEVHRFLVADPAKGSRHNRGAAVDLTLCDAKTGEPLPMPSGYDEPSDRAYPDYPGGTSTARHFRDVLRGAMEAEGFTVYPEEWWHFDYKDWREYPIMNVPFERLEQ